MGIVDPQTLPAVLSTSAGAQPKNKAKEVDLAEIIGLPDFDAAAQAKLTGKAWAYMKSGATDECSE
jgi:L-lactate dehydrogenase (cytochrome)